MAARRSIFLAAAIAATVSLSAGAQRGGPAAPQISSQNSEPRATALITSVVRSELAAAERDRSVWAYRDQDRTAEKDAVYQVIDTPEGGVRRMIESHREPVDAETRQRETERIQSFIHNPQAQAKQHRASAHDDAQARDMLLMLPTAFIWTVKSDSNDLITLTFRPNPTFDAPNIEARVMGTMAGEVIIAKADNRIRTLRGALSDDVKIGYGMLGKLRHGGTFDVERREIAPHIWQITETHVHIDGRALLFKTIGQQEDEVKTDWKPSPASTLEQAARELGAN